MRRDFSDRNGFVDTAKAGNAIRQQVKEALDQGREVNMVVEGKPRRIVSVSNLGLVDEQGNPWGTAQLMMQRADEHDHISIGEQPVAQPAEEPTEEPVKKSFWQQFPTQIGQAIDAEPIAEEAPPQRRPGTLRVGRNAPVEVAEMKVRPKVNEEARARAEARQSKNVGDATVKTDLHGALVDEARGRAADALGDQEFAKLSEDPRFTEEAEAAARDVAPQASETESVAGNARGLSQQLVDNIKDRFAKLHEADKNQRAADEAASIKRERERKLEEEAHRAATVKAQERERGEGKSANAFENESPVTIKRHYDAELKKPESERDPDLIAWGEAYEARKEFPGKSKQKKDIEGRKVLHRRHAGGIMSGAWLSGVSAIGLPKRHASRS